MKFLMAKLDTGNINKLITQSNIDDNFRNYEDDQWYWNTWAMI